jgi:arginine transport system substrate-binding protein
MVTTEFAMKKLLIAAVLASVSLSASAAETIRFAMEASYPPFEFVDSSNKIQGFDVDLANAMCKQMQADCTFTNQAFDSLIPSLKFRRFDAVISGMDITADRQKQVAFTDAYYDNSAIFIAEKGKFADLAALKGKRVGMQNGSTHQKFLMEKHPEITAVSYDSYQNAVLDLKNGRLDAVFGDTAVVNEWLKQNPNLAAVGDKITDKTYFGTGLGIAVRQNNTELLTKMNAALAKVKQDGTYQTLYSKWFQQ